MFFFSFFWSFFHNSLAPNTETGNIWPPISITPINPYQVPLLNTTILLSSGIFVTLRHNRILIKNNKIAKNNIINTVLLGVYFTVLQAWEYSERFYSYRDSSFGSTFFTATGFHGTHVIIGTALLFSMLLRHTIGINSSQHHTGFEVRIWYWHFVDVIWLFLFTFLYWWSFLSISISKYS